MSEKSESSCIQNSNETHPPAEKSSTPGTSQQTNQTSKLNQYSRIKIMSQLLDEGCDIKSCTKAVHNLKLNPEDAEKFVNEKARAAQDHVHEECESACYKNISNWLDYYKSKNFHNEANYESALIMIAIADMEHHPDPKETGGVDFKKIYRFLGDVMLGNPTPELNTESKEFLGQEFENLINLANTTQGDEDTKDLHEKIQQSSKKIIPEPSKADKKRRKEFGSLDPMGIDKFISSNSNRRDKKPS